MIDLGKLWATRIEKLELELVPYRTIRMELRNDDQRKIFEIRLTQVEQIEFGDARPHCEWDYAELASVDCNSSSDGTKKEVRMEIWGSANMAVHCKDISIRELPSTD